MTKNYDELEKKDIAYLAHMGSLFVFEYLYNCLMVLVMIIVVVFAKSWLSLALRALGLPVDWLEERQQRPPTRRGPIIE